MSHWHLDNERRQIQAEVRVERVPGSSTVRRSPTQPQTPAWEGSMSISSTRHAMGTALTRAHDSHDPVGLLVEGQRMDGHWMQGHVAAVDTRQADSHRR
jgi:hypothetical protein